MSPRTGALFPTTSLCRSADFPGLIEGAADGVGIGVRFLGHIGRWRVLLQLVGGSAEDPVDTYLVVRDELDAYGGGLAEKAEIVVLNKMDAVDAKTLSRLMKKLEKKSGAPVLAMSGATGEGVIRRTWREREAAGRRGRRVRR